jgi:hypothetical protein
MSVRSEKIAEAIYMFSRIREAVRIITHREPENGADAVIVEQENTASSRAGTFIAHFLEFFILAYLFGFFAGRIGPIIYKFVPHPHIASVSTIIGAIGFLLAVWLHSIRNDIEKHLRAQLDLAKVLAPYFGHRLTNAIRTMKGSVRVA